MPEQVSRKAYRTETPNLIDEWGLDAYSYRLYGHYRRWCGEHGTYNKTVRQTAPLIKMSPAQVSRARQKLLDKELIVMEPDGSVRVTDLWDLNRAWFIATRRRDVSIRDKLVSIRDKPVSNRNDLSLIETSLYRKNLLERTIEDTTTSEREGGGGGGAIPTLAPPRPEHEQPLSVYTYEQVSVWAESVPGIVVPDQFAKHRWLDGLADRRIAAFYARLEATQATAAEAAAPLEPERLPPDLEAEVTAMLADSLEMGATPEHLDEQFSAGIPPDQWAVMREAAIAEFVSRRDAQAGDDVGGRVTHEADGAGAT